SELPVAVLEIAPTSVVPVHGKFSFRPLPRIRVAEPYEALRDASDRALAATGNRPRVFLATLGTPADFTARATFARNFFEAGGIEASGGDAFATREEMMSAFRASGAALVCLCSSDKIYETQAADAARVLGEAGARHVYLAGRGDRLETALKDTGVGAFI